MYKKLYELYFYDYAAMVEGLISRTTVWEAENGVEFLYDGVRFIFFLFDFCLKSISKMSRLFSLLDYIGLLGTASKHARAIQLVKARERPRKAKAKSTKALL